MSKLIGKFIVHTNTVYRVFEVLPDGRLLVERFTLKLEKDCARFVGKHTPGDSNNRKFFSINIPVNGVPWYESECDAVRSCVNQTINMMKENGDILGDEDWVMHCKDRLNMLKVRVNKKSCSA